MPRTVVEETFEELEKFIDAGYNHLGRIEESFRPRLFFSDKGFGRLMMIRGYIHGLYAGGFKSLANRALRDLRSCLDSLMDHNVQTKLQFHESIGSVVSCKEVEVPSSKCLLHDDGTLHGFSFVKLFPIRPEVLRESVVRAVKQSVGEGFDFTYIDDYDLWRGFNNVRSKVFSELNIQTNDLNNSGVDLITEVRYIDGQRRHIFYRYGYNGGLIYHGPDAGENFTVNNDTSGRWWGLHT